MSIAIRSPKQYWTESQWRAYIAKLCRLRRIFWEFVFQMPESQGLRPSHRKPWIEAHRSIVTAMIRLEKTVVLHMGGEDCVPGGAIRFCQGRMPDDDRKPDGEKDESDVTIASMKGRAKRAIPPLAREQWLEWGAKAREAHNLIGAMIGEVWFARGLDVRRHITALQKTQKHVTVARGCLETLVCRQHRDWDDAIRVFFGPSKKAP
jgi:hypothetical protein